MQPKAAEHRGLALALLTSASMIGVVTSCDPGEGALAQTVPPSNPGPVSTIVDDVVAEFAVRFRSRTTRAIAEAHRSQLEIWDEQGDPRLGDWRRRLLQSLPDDPLIQDLLFERPHLATLFALVPQPELWEPALRDRKLLETAIISLSLFGEQPEIGRMASSFPLHLRRLDRLLSMGNATAIPVFCFDREEPGAAEYDQFLDALIDDHVLARPDLAVRALGALHMVGRDLRRRLARDAELRSVLSDNIDELMLFIGRDLENVEVLASSPHILDMLALPRGLDLVRDRGVIAAEILFGRGLPTEMRESVADWLRIIPSESAHGLWYAAAWPHRTAALLGQPVEPGVIFTALRQVGEDPNPNAHLVYLSRLPPEGLVAECEPPPPAAVQALPLYSIYAVAQSALRGQRIESLDLVFAAIDAATFMVPAAKGSIAAAGAVKTARATGSTISAATRDVAKQGLEAGKKRIAREFSDLAATAVDPEAVARMAARNWDTVADLATLALTDGEYAIPFQASRRLTSSVSSAAKEHGVSMKGLRRALLGVVSSGSSEAYTIRLVRFTAGEMAEGVVAGNALATGLELVNRDREAIPLSDEDLSRCWFEALLGPETSPADD